MTQINKTRYGFLLLPGFTMISLTASVEPLRMANRVSGQPLYEYFLFSLNGKPVEASNGLSLQPITALDYNETIDVLFVCAGISLDKAWEPPLLAQRQCLQPRQPAWLLSAPRYVPPCLHWRS